MYGYPKNEAIGKKLTELIVPNETENDFLKIISSMEKDRTYVCASENTFLTKKKEKNSRILQLFGSPDSGGSA